MILRTKQKQVDKIAKVDYEKLNERFISEAEGEWDEDGEGWFDEYIVSSVWLKWYWYMRSN